MKCLTTLSLLITTLTLLSSTSASFLPRILAETAIQNPSDDKNSHGLKAFTNFLTRYPFSTALKGLSGYIINQCEPSTPSEQSYPLNMNCLLVKFSSDSGSNQTETLNLFLNESTKYILDLENSTIVLKGVPVESQSLNNAVIVSEKSCVSDVSYYLVNEATKKPFSYSSDKFKDLSIQIALYGGDCDANIVTPLLLHPMKEAQGFEVYLYIGFMVVLGLIQTVTCGLLVIKIDRNNTVAKRSSIGTLCSLVAFDFYIYLTHFTYWTSISNWMALVFVLFFIISVFFEPALVYFVFLTLQRRNNIGIRTLLMQLYFWLIILAIGVIISQVVSPDYLFYTFPLFLVPQIVDNFCYFQKYRFNFPLLFGLALPKLLYITLVSVDPFRMFNANFGYSMVVYAVTVIGIQLGVLKVQGKLPGLGLRAKNVVQYNYFCEKTEVDESSNVICSICTEKIGSTPIIGEQPCSEQEQSAVSEEQQVMKTPCLHYYHESCLKEWFKKKFECPNCRQPVPVIEDEGDD